MKIYLSYDIEGITGLTDSAKDIDPDRSSFIQAMELSTHDVNAAVEGALAGGATEIVINDGHGWNRRNLLFEKLHPRAKLIRARVSTPGLNMAAFDDTYDAVFFIGWHSRASSRGVLAHCLNSKAFSAWRLNGTEIGEPELAAGYAGTFAVPMVLFSGDDAACQEVRCWSPDSIFVETKKTIDYYSAICHSTEETWDLIRNGAEAAVKKASSIAPFAIKAPYVLEADTLTDHIAGAIAEIPEIEWVSARTVRYSSDDFRQIFQASHAMQLISGVAL